MWFGGFRNVTRPSRPLLQSLVVEPARNRVAAEPGDATAITLHLGDQSIVDPVQPTWQFLYAALRTERSHQRLSQRGKAGDIGK